MSNKKVLITTVYSEISHLDYLFILYIKQLRERNNWTQQDLSKKMGVSKSFVGNVESFIQRHKYSIRHLGLLAKAFRYKSVANLFDFPAPDYDMIKLTLKVTRVIQDSGKVRNKLVEVVKVEPIE
jgi:transcriptional regulator with XRE-family HTH domain